MLHEWSCVMYHFYVDEISTHSGKHRVHKLGCSCMKLDRIYLGEFSSCKNAMEEAKKIYKEVKGCHHCCRECYLNDSVEKSPLQQEKAETS